ncbi:hypothetical protein GCM10008924_30260 [Gracilibacillus halotolerans]|uniref:hypothetical protein n=1 Tax=Gracilibacillus halotolerans TaxID=74386 RepID=UPI001FE394C1|nr:hypothetical protein [Gracilibacillus halotolerans]
MKSIHMKEHFEKIYRQREEKEEELGKYSGQEWGRPKENKWSWGETYYHLYLFNDEMVSSIK